MKSQISVCPCSEQFFPTSTTRIPGARYRWSDFTAIPSTTTNLDTTYSKTSHITPFFVPSKGSTDYDFNLWASAGQLVSAQTQTTRNIKFSRSVMEAELLF